MKRKNVYIAKILIMWVLGFMTCITMGGCAEQRLHDAVENVQRLCRTSPYMLGNGCVVTNLMWDGDAVTLYAVCPVPFFELADASTKAFCFHDFFAADSQTIELYRAMCGYGNALRISCQDEDNSMHDTVTISPDDVNSLFLELKE